MTPPLQRQRQEWPRMQVKSLPVARPTPIRPRWHARKSHRGAALDHKVRVASFDAPLFVAGGSPDHLLDGFALRDAQVEERKGEQAGFTHEQALARPERLSRILRAAACPHRCHTRPPQRPPRPPSPARPYPNTPQHRRSDCHHDIARTARS